MTTGFTDLNDLVRASIFTALAIGLGYSLLLVPNVELITVVVFLAGISLGGFWGLLVGMTAIGLYSIMNPLGSGLMNPPLLVAQVLSMGIIGAVAGFLKPVFLVPRYGRLRIISLGMAGFTATVLYDLFTTLAYPLAAGYDLTQTIGFAVSGLVFTFTHQISNFIVFTLAVPPVVKHLV